MTVPKFSTLYDHHDGPELSEFEPTKTRQEFKDEADINNILSRYERDGIIPETRDGAPQFADLTDPIFTDFQRAQNIVIDAQEAFEALPARVRERFNNDPASLIQFIQEPNNRAEAIELGLINRPMETPAAEPPAQVTK